MTSEEKTQVIHQVEELMKPFIQESDHGYVFFIADAHLDREHPVRLTSNLKPEGLFIVLNSLALAAHERLLKGDWD